MQISNSNIINVENIANLFNLSKTDTAIVNQAVEGYFNADKVNLLGSLIINAIKIPIRCSDLQKGIKVLKKNIDCEENEKLAIFLLDYCLSSKIHESTAVNLCPAPFDYCTWTSENYDDLTLDKVIDKWKVTLHPFAPSSYVKSANNLKKIN